MSAKANRKRARRARQRQDLLSLRAELVLLYDGKPIPDHYLNSNRMDTRERVRTIKALASTSFSRRSGYQSAYQAQIDKAAMQLQQDIDRQVIADLLKLSSLDT